ncbi:hypothetical protein DAI22_08g213800 [Oryza sativa Japonica Group]|nr:hypothetical protein DAI22_08g213800 [Oryza sativa Japonica Group]
MPPSAAAWAGWQRPHLPLPPPPRRSAPKPHAWARARAPYPHSRGLLSRLGRRQAPRQPPPRRRERECERHGQ